MVNQSLRDQFVRRLQAKGDPKLKAAAGFLARLLDKNNPVYKSVARVILFGSVARQKAKPESDIDLILVGAEDLSTLQEQAEAAAFDTLLEEGEVISPMVYSLNEITFPESYFLYRTLETGKEIYHMDNEQMRRKEAEIYERLAAEFVQSAEHALVGGFRRGAVDNAYNAAELVAQALLILKLEEIPKSHGGIAAMFGKVYVTSEIAPRELGRELQKGLHLRHKARYDGLVTISEEDARNTIRLAKDILSFLHNYLKIQEA